MRELRRMIAYLIGAYFVLFYIQTSEGSEPVDAENKSKDQKAVMGHIVQKAAELRPTGRVTPQSATVITTPFVGSSRSISTSTTPLIPPQRVTSNFIATSFRFPLSSSFPERPSTSQMETAKLSSTIGLSGEGGTRSTTPIFIAPDASRSTSARQGDPSGLSINPGSLSSGRSTSEPLRLLSGSSMEGNDFASSTTINVVPMSVTSSKTVDSNPISSTTASMSDWEAFLNMIHSRWPQLFGLFTTTAYIPSSSPNKPSSESFHQTTSQKSPMNSEMDTQSEGGNTISLVANTKQNDMVTGFSEVSVGRVDENATTANNSARPTTAETSRNSGTSLEPRAYSNERAETQNGIGSTESPKVNQQNDTSAGLTGAGLTGAGLTSARVEIAATTAGRPSEALRDTTRQGDTTAGISDQVVNTATLTGSQVVTTASSGRLSTLQSQLPNDSSSHLITTIKSLETSSTNEATHSETSAPNIRNAEVNISLLDTSTTASKLTVDLTTMGLELRCGISPLKHPIEIKIVGGEDAYPNSWPWQVALLFYGQLYCGGSLIDEYHIITAAHCVSEDSIHSDPSKWTALLGKHDLSINESTEVRRQISKIDINPFFNSKTVNNDMAIMTLTQPVDLSTSAISPICLPSPTTPLPPGTVCWATGWGATSGSTGDYPAKLQEVNLTIIDPGVCNSSLWYNGRLTDAMICAGYPQGGKDTCSGDSGGPLACLVDSHWALMGVTSFGAGCGAPMRPGVYSRVTEFLNWINTTIY